MFTIKEGGSEKIGVTFTEQGANFCIYSRLATSVELLFFDDKNAKSPSQIFVLSDLLNKTAYYWHIFIGGVKAGQLYGFRINGETKKEIGVNFFPEKVLIDPYGVLVDRGDNFSRQAAIDPGSNVDKCLKSVVVDIDNYDWEGDRHPRHSFAKTVIYEMHVAGFTKHKSSGLSDNLRGTYAGLVEKIPYLKSLGITAVELMPVHQFDPTEHHAGLTNYWGYSPLSLFSVHREYSSDQSPLGPINEFRNMVKALHKADIEVILDVVYNHTAEGDAQGPTLSLRGFDSTVYYILSKDRQHHMNFSGCGNTLNGTHSVVRRMIIDSLHFWVEKMHIDGFRFDLASILSRDEVGRPMPSPPTLWSIETDPVLAPVKLIAEAWDAAGLYQVGSLAGRRWREWNGRFRDDVRSFIRGDEGTVSKLASRIIGSPDIYGAQGLEPEKSVNFVTSHDGFTLYDLVSYNEKHNKENGENNRDGDDHNLSWNHGVEGETEDENINKLRHKQMKNMLAITLLSLGTPMLLMGDEVARSQKGNNNGYCQDNEDFWFNWDNVEKNKALLNFTRELIKHRTKHEILEIEETFVDVRRGSLNSILKKSNIFWHGVKLHHPDWGDDSRSLVLEIRPPQSEKTYVFIFNAYWDDLEFELPKARSGKWGLFIDTSLEDGEDILKDGVSKKYYYQTYTSKARSTVVLRG
jgi:glycogen operon protein